MVTPTPKITVSDENGHRELTGQELEDFLIDRSKLEAEVEALNAEAEAKAEAKAAAQAKLAALGLTVEDLTALGL
jgi:hypothetical protein